MDAFTSGLAGHHLSHPGLWGRHPGHPGAGPQFDRVVCCGGDGTLSETAAGLLALPQPLCWLYPSGSTNDCAATLRIPLGYKPAAELAAGDTLR